MSEITAKEILRQFDDSFSAGHFPRLDQPDRVQTAAVRLHAFRDAGRWAVVIEQLGCDVQAASFDLDLYAYGNCLKETPGLCDVGMISPTDDGSDGDVFDVVDWGLIRPNAKNIRLRERLVPFDLSPDSFAAREIRLTKTPRVTGAELLRLLVVGYREELLATETEIRQLVPAGLPRLLTLHEWHHPDFADGERPGRSELCQLLAETLVTGDTSRYKPTQPANTDWRLWV